MTKHLFRFFSIVMVFMMLASCPTDDKADDNDDTTSVQSSSSISDDSSSQDVTNSSDDSSTESSSTSDSSSEQTVLSDSSYSESSDSSSSADNTNNNNNNGGSNPSTNPSSNKITSLQLVIDDAKTGDLIDLSQYQEITDWSATINKSLTLNGNSTSFGGNILTIESDLVNLNGLTNVNVTVSPSLGNGSLKIASSSLSSLSIFGGGIGSIVLEDCSVDVVEVNKDMTAENAEFVRLVVDNRVKVGNLTASSPLFIDGQTSSPAWLTNFDLSGDDINVAFSKDLSIDTGDYLNVLCYNDDASTDRLQMNIVLKKGEQFNSVLFAATFAKKYGELDFDVTEFTKDVAQMAEDLAANSDIDDYDIYLVMTHVNVTLVIEDLEDTGVGAVFIYGYLPDVSEDGVIKSGFWKNTPDEAPSEYCQNVVDGKCVFQFDEIAIKKHKTDVVDQNGFTYGGTEEGWQFFVVPMADRNSYSDFGSPWNEKYFTPITFGTETKDSYTGITKKNELGQDVSPDYVHYVIWKEWVSIGGEMNYIDGKFDKYYDRAMNIKFDEIMSIENFKKKEKYVKITINKQYYPEMYYSDYPTNSVLSVPTFPTNIGYKDESVDLTLGHRPRKITLYGSDKDNPSKGYDIEFQSQPW